MENNQENVNDLRSLFPELSEQDLGEAEEYLRAYVDSAIRQYTRIASDLNGETLLRLRALTKRRSRRYADKRKVDNIN